MFFRRSKKNAGLGLFFCNSTHNNPYSYVNVIQACIFVVMFPSLLLMVELGSWFEMYVMWEAV